MQKNLSKVRRANSVKAMFENGLSTFLLSYDATLEELASHLGDLAEQHQERPIAVIVKLGSRDELTLSANAAFYPALRRNASARPARFTIVPQFLPAPRQLEAGEKQ